MIDYGKTDIDISCRINGTSIERIAIIQLKRSDTNIVSLSDKGVFWQDKKTETRSKVDANITNILSSYLHLNIMACNVNQTIDEGSYQCALVASGNENPLIERDSYIVNLNITGIDLITHLFVFRLSIHI